MILRMSPRLSLLILHCVSVGIFLFYFISSMTIFAPLTLHNHDYFLPALSSLLFPALSLSIKKCLSEGHAHLYCHFYSVMTKTSHFCLPLLKKKNIKSPIMTPLSRRISSLSLFSCFLHSNGKLLAVVLDQCVEIR